MLRLHMAPSGVRIVAGVSGGADSVCLLLVLHSLSRQMGFELEAVHVEHGIRGQESIRDAEFTEALCAEIAVPCTRYEVNVPEYAKKQHLGFEEAARKLRYDAFFRRAEEIRQTTGKQAVIALAHHREDNAETVLFRLLRGSGLRGLCGIRPVLRYRDYVVIRPLLETGRGEIESYLSKRGKTYCRDSTNEDEAYSRNRLRRRILPENRRSASAQATLRQSSTRARIFCLR